MVSEVLVLNPRDQIFMLINYTTATRLPSLSWCSEVVVSYLYSSFRYYNPTPNDVYSVIWKGEITKRKYDKLVSRFLELHDTKAASGKYHCS